MDPVDLSSCYIEVDLFLRLVVIGHDDEGRASKLEMWIDDLN